MTDKYQVMFEWIRQNGGYVDEDLYIEENESKDRLVKTRKKKEKVDLMIIPKKCCIEGENQLEIMKNMLKELSSSDMGSFSFYKPYLDTLPPFSSFSNHPFLNFNEADIPIIKTINEEAGFHLEKLHKIFNEVKNELNCYEEKAKYVFLLFNTRSWSTGFVPLVDLMQHSETRCNINTLVKTENEYKISAISVRDEVINCYRSASFIELFITYNIPFGIKERLCDDFAIINFKINDAELQQIEFLKTLNLYTEPMCFYFNDSVVLSTLQKARILTWKENLNSESRQQFSYKGLNSIDNDKDALRYIFILLIEARLISPKNVLFKYKIFEDATKRFNEILNNTKKSYSDFWQEYIKVVGTYVKEIYDNDFKIDHIFISHYTKLTERKAYMSKAIEDMKLSDVAPITWVDFFDRENLTQQQRDEYVCFRLGLSDTILIPAQISNALGHYYCIEKIANDPSIQIGMIIEDDIIFKKNYIYRLKKVLKYLPSNWDIVSIGGAAYGGPDCCRISETMEVNDEKPSIYRPATTGLATGNYIINKQSAKRIISHPIYKPFSCPIDWTLIHIARSLNLNVFWCRPFLSFEGSKDGQYETSCSTEKVFFK